MDTIKRGDVIILENRRVWLLMTDEEKKAQRDADLAAGHFHDSAGEPIIYGPYMGLPQNSYIKVQVTSLRPVWHSYCRPKFLAAGWSHELGREVLFQRV
jgi:hypothetical protein